MGQHCVALLLLAAAVVLCHARDMLQDDGVQASIVNGYNAPRNRHPWVVSLRANDGKGNWHFCMGALIDESVVMTSASCVRNPNTGKNLPKEYYSPLVRIGGYLRSSDGRGSYQLRTVVKTVVHPKFVTGYVNDNSNNDIALLLLDKPSTKTPIGLPKYTPKPKMPLRAMSGLFAVGWGWTSPTRPSEAERLQQIGMSLLPLSACQQQWGKDKLIDRSTTPPTVYTIRTNFNRNSMLCAAHAANTARPNGGACWGDGGAPYFRRGLGPDRDVIYGVDSFGPNVCGKGSYVMTDVAALRRWIDITVTALTTSDWKGRVWGDPNVLGFDGSRFQTTTPAGRQLTILNFKKGPMSLVAALAKHPANPKLTVMRRLVFKWGGRVVVSFKNNKTHVTVNGKLLRPGHFRKFNGGRVRYREELARWSQSIVIEQPGLAIRINRVYSKRQKAFLPWFDIWAFLSAKPRWRLGGVLGRTFPEVAASAAFGGGPLDFSAGFVMS